MSNSMEYIHWGPVKCGLYKQVVFVYRWSLEQVWLYLQTAKNKLPVPTNAKTGTQQRAMKHKHYVTSPHLLSQPPWPGWEQTRHPRCSPRVWWGPGYVNSSGGSSSRVWYPECSPGLCCLAPPSGSRTWKRCSQNQCTMFDILEWISWAFFPMSCSSMWFYIRTWALCYTKNR